MASVTRRTFLARTGLGTLAVGAAGSPLLFAGPARAAVRVAEPAPTITAPATTAAAVSLEAHRGKHEEHQRTNHDSPYERTH